MLSVRNAAAMLHCEEDGSLLALTDLARGTRWELDGDSLVYETAAPAGAAAGASGQPPLQRLTPVGASASGESSLTVAYRAGEEDVRLRFDMRERFVEVRLLAEGLKAAAAVSLPGSFAPAGESLEIVLPIMQGMLWKGKGEPFDWRLGESRHGGYSMPIVGYMSSTGGLLVTAETQDDLELRVVKRGNGKFGAAYMQTASLGTIRYDRVARLYVTAPDIVAIAKTYRSKIVEQGRFKGWEEKIAERPGLERLFGSLMCFIGYCQDDLDYAKECEKLRRFGFDRALIYPARFNTYNNDIRMGGLPPIHLSRETVAQIKRLGYDLAPWSWINEALDDKSAYVNRIYRKDAAGSRIPHWGIDDQRWYWCCTTFMEQFQRNANAGEFADMTWDHFDVIACAANNECHATDHPAHPGRPLSRTEDREWIKKLLVAGQNGSRAVSSEGFNDAYAAEYDLGSVKALPMFNRWPFWPVPLTSLVYHDSMIHSWWEMHSYNNPYFGRLNGSNMYEYGGGRPRIQASMDALMGTPPDVFPFGAQYMWTGKGSETFAYRYRFEDPEVQFALREALPVAQLHRRIGKQEMVHFKMLSEDGNVQETAFADGTRIIANFSGSLRGDIPGQDPVHAESWRSTL
ncbi:hypothetical protein GXP70_22325 [Paenibacillus lycopersici]|uniref:Uncharacterized protein n=1 Tax=Paenibacillus lycopersici TaxID=2704462 RepID=A0A6C0FZ87_9BACL|nr:hypothetical protein [Paenibacillus lycopersici]QHT62448.1 hypothetical protein GXP70_22325 [Paenibacillus lycopersici]